MPKKYGPRRRTRYTPGRRRGIKYSSGQNMKQFSRGPGIKLIHVFPSDQSGNYTINGTNASPANLGVNPNAMLLNNIPKSSGLANRIGTKIRMRELLINWECIMGDSAGVTGAIHQHGRLVVVYDRRPSWGSAVAPTLTDLYENLAFTGFRALNSRDRFDILWEKEIALEAEYVWNGSAIQSRICKSSDMRGSVRIPIYRKAAWQTDNTTGTLDGFTYGPLYLMFLSPSAFTSSVSPYCIFNWKLAFDDLMF